MIVLARLYLLCALAFAAPTLAAESPAAAQSVAGERVHANLAYGPHPERNILDLYLPDSPAERPWPVIVWIHSGGWYTGGKGGGGAARALVKRGYAVAAITYRFSQDAIFPAQIEDCQRAIRWLRAQAETYNLDPSRIGAWGGSAGGHLAALLGTAPDRFPAPADDAHRNFSASVAAVCAHNPPTDFARWDAQALPEPQVVANQPDSMVARLLGGPPNQAPDAARRASPITYVSRSSAPFFLVHGEADRAVPPQQSITFDAALRAAGVESTLHLIPGAGHANAAFAQGIPHAAIAAFFDRHLKLPLAVTAATPPSKARPAWSFTPDPALPNVLLLGDSISVGYTLGVRARLAGRANVFRPLLPDGSGPENCEGTTLSVRRIEPWLAGRKWDVIHFNWGLHDLKHVQRAGTSENSDDAADPVQATIPVYIANLRQILTRLQATGARLVFATTTPVAPDTRNPLRSPDSPPAYNAAAVALMKAQGIRVNDLFALTAPRLSELQHPRNVHFNAAGSEVLATEVARIIGEELDRRAR